MLAPEGVSLFSRRRRRRDATERLDREEAPRGQQREELDAHARRHLDAIAEKARAVTEAFEAPREARPPREAPLTLDAGYLTPEDAAPAPPDRFAEGSAPKHRHPARPTPAGFYDAPTNPYIPPPAAAPALFFDEEEEVTAKVIVDEAWLYADEEEDDDCETLIRPRPRPLPPAAEHTPTS